MQGIKNYEIKNGIITIKGSNFTNKAYVICIEDKRYYISGALLRLANCNNESQITMKLLRKSDKAAIRFYKKNEQRLKEIYKNNKKNREKISALDSYIKTYESYLDNIFNYL